MCSKALKYRLASSPLCWLVRQPGSQEPRIHCRAAGERWVLSSLLRLLILRRWRHPSPKPAQHHSVGSGLEQLPVVIQECCPGYRLDLSYTDEPRKYGVALFGAAVNARVPDPPTKPLAGTPNPILCRCRHPSRNGRPGSLQVTGHEQASPVRAVVLVSAEAEPVAVLPSGIFTKNCGRRGFSEV